MRSLMSAYAAASRPLDLHEEVSDATSPKECVRWPEALRLLSSTGVLAKGRCGSTNVCEYCARLSAVEISERLALDAIESGNAPTVWLVLTTPRIDPNPSAYYEDRRQLVRAIETRLGRVEWASVIEFTTGYGERSGGHRRPHFNVLLKNVAADDHTLALIEDAVRSVWCERQGASPDAQYVGAIEHQGGLMQYLALHFLKESQRPPSSWAGSRFQRFTYSRHGRGREGYFGTPGWKSKRHAQQSLRWKRALHRAILAGHNGPEADAIADIETIRAQQVRWQLVKMEERVEMPTGVLVQKVWALDGSEPSVWRPDRSERLREREAWERDYSEWSAARGDDATAATPPLAHRTTPAPENLALPV